MQNFEYQINKAESLKYKIIVPIENWDKKSKDNLRLYVNCKEQELKTEWNNNNFVIHRLDPIGEYIFNITLKHGSEIIQTKQIIMNIVENNITKINNKSNHLEVKLIETRKIDFNVTRVVISSDDALMGICWNKDIRIFNYITLELQSELLGHKEHISCLYMNQEEDEFISAGRDKIISWDLKKEMIKNVHSFRRRTTILGFNSTGKKAIESIYNNDKDKWIQLVDFSNGEIICKINIVDDLAHCAILDPDEKNIVIGFSSGRIMFYSVLNSKVINTGFMYENGSVSRLLFSPDGKYLFSNTSGSSSFKVWDLNSYKIQKPIFNHKGHGNFINIQDFIIRKEGRELVTIGGYSINIWKLEYK